MPLSSIINKTQTTTKATATIDNDTIMCILFLTAVISKWGLFVFCFGGRNSDNNSSYNVVVISHYYAFGSD